MESPSKRLRLTKPVPIQTPPPPTPARASPTRGPRASWGRRRSSKPTSSPSCRDRGLKWPPVRPGCAKEAEMPGLITEGGRGTARGGTKVGTAPSAPWLTRGRQSLQDSLWHHQNSDMISSDQQKGGTQHLQHVAPPTQSPPPTAEA